MKRTLLTLFLAPIFIALAIVAFAVAFATGLFDYFLTKVNRWLPKRLRSARRQIYNEYYRSHLSINEGRDAWERECANIPEQAKRLFALEGAIHMIETEGFFDYFLSEIGSLAPYALDALNDMDVPQLSQPLRSAMDKIERPFPLEIARRREILLERQPEIDFETEEREFEIMFGLKSIQFRLSRDLRKRIELYALQAFDSA